MWRRNIFIIYNYDCFYAVHFEEVLTRFYYFRGLEFHLVIQFHSVASFSFCSEQDFTSSAEKMNDRFLHIAVLILIPSHSVQIAAEIFDCWEFSTLQNFRIVKYAHICNQGGKCIKMSTNKPMFGLVVL